VEALLGKLVAGSLGSSEETELYGTHQRHFRRRARVLDASFFPGREKSDPAIESLGNGAYASFKSEPTHEGQPAFAYALARQLPPLPFLYYWRNSATLQFLRREGPERLRDRFKLFRNIRLNLKDGFEAVGERAGEALFAPERWKGKRRDPALDLDTLRVDLDKKRGKALLLAVFEAAGAPLTRAELGRVLEKNLGLEDGQEVKVAAEIEVADSGAAASAMDSGIAKAQIEQRARAFFARLPAEQRALLGARGYGEEGERRSFRQVAQQLGRLKEESYRLMERKILEALRTEFADPEELALAVPALIQCLVGASVGAGQSPS
jgi:hypothetical protein